LIKGSFCLLIRLKKFRFNWKLEMEGLYDAGILQIIGLHPIIVIFRYFRALWEKRKMKLKLNLKLKLKLKNHPIEFQALKGRHNLAQGVSPGNCETARRERSPEGAA